MPGLIVQPEDQLRSVSADVAHLELKRDGVVEGRIVPYLTPTDVVEVIRGRVVEYREQFAPGSFSRAAAAPRRVGLTFTHSDLMPDRMGYGLSLRDSDDGAVMTWKLYDYAREQAEELLTTTHSGLSVTFRTLRPQYGTESDGALITREAVHLRAVAATDDPAYADAHVLALRESAALLAEQREAQRQREQQQVDLILYLQDHGRQLTPAQLAFLDQHRAHAHA